MVPKRFDSEAKTKENMGFSDHFAVVVKLSYPELKTEPAKKGKMVKSKKVRKKI